MVNRNLIEHKYIIIHHSGVLNSENDLKGEKQWKAICKNYQKNWSKKYPWVTAPYHFGIGKKGNIFNGQDENSFCIHAGDDFYNYRSIAVCFIGNFEVEEMNDNQLLSGVNLVKDLMKKYDISIEEILKHKDLIITQCPGKNFPWEKFTNKILDIPQYKYDSIEFGIKTGLIKNSHRPDEIVDFGTLLTILKNFYEVIKNG